MHKAVLLLSLLTATNSAQAEIAQKIYEKLDIPAYAQWGRLAIEETKVKYPHAQILDYSYEGSERKGESTVEKFKLWLKEGMREFGVEIKIEYMTETEKVSTIEMKETVN